MVQSAIIAIVIKRHQYKKSWPRDAHQITAQGKMIRQYRLLQPQNTSLAWQENEANQKSQRAQASPMPAFSM